MIFEDALSAALQTFSSSFYAVPGYPVTSLIEKCGAEIVINEKTALEYALGDALAGKRAVVIVKNAGVNVLLDPLTAAVCQGIGSGILIIAGDDTIPSGSQTAQDTRSFSAVRGIIVREPLLFDAEETVEQAFYCSEEYSRPVILRVTAEELSTKTPALQTHSPQRTGHASLHPASLTIKGRFEYAENITDRFSGLPPRRTPETYQSRGNMKSLCPDCPFKPVFAYFRDRRISVICDTGCSLFSQNPHYGFGLANYGLGSSPAVAAKSTRIALTGDYAVLHSGINSLIDITEKQLDLLCVVLKNHTAAMTGRQSCPDAGRYLSLFHPTVMDARDAGIYAELEHPIDHLKILIIEGACPQGETHETITC